MNTSFEQIPREFQTAAKRWAKLGFEVTATEGALNICRDDLQFRFGKNKQLIFKKHLYRPETRNMIGRTPAEVIYQIDEWMLIETEART